MTSKRIFALLALACLTPAARLQAAEADLIQPAEVRCLVADGKHNAFTAMVRWHDAYWLAFRKAQSHNSADGDVIVLRSEDAVDWDETLRLDILPDDRDPQFLATDNRLLLYDPALKGSALTSYVTFTEDGKQWSEPQAVYEPTYILWKPVAHGGRFFATAHVKSRDGASRNVHLITSENGLDWKKVSQIRGGNWESETTIHFVADDRIVAFLRQKYGSPQASLLYSTAPFAEWTERPAPQIHFSGHSAYTFNGVHYLLSRTYQSGRESPGTIIYTFGDDGQLAPYCRLPSGGDCSYPAAVQIGQQMLVSYYSTHEGSTNVYLARVPLKAR